MSNFINLQIDKEDSNVLYNDKLHKYWTKNDNLSCISVTTLIHNFANFDEEFWSCYKTLEKMINEDDFKVEKDELLKFKKFNYSVLKKYDIDENSFIKEKESILKEWETKRETSCIRGAGIHKQFELNNLAENNKELQYLKSGGKLSGNFSTFTSNKIVPGLKGAYPELLLSRISEDKKLRLAGQADLVIIDEFDIYVIDYKTNAKIDTSSYFDRRKKRKEMMKYPLNNIEDSNFWHYSLQLSTYAWMIQKIDPRFNIKLLMLVHIDHKDKVTNYECNYLKSDVERMLAFYKQRISDKEFYKSLEKRKWE